jgi:hypothetical protein
MLFKTLATLRTDVEVGTVDAWRWTGLATDAEARMASVDAPDALRKLRRLADQRSRA